jgi:hypothetical protein
MRLSIFRGLVAVADHPLGRDPGGTIGAGRKTVEHRVRGLVSLGLVGDPEPLLVTILFQQSDDRRDQRENPNDHPEDGSDKRAPRVLPGLLFARLPLLLFLSKPSESTLSTSFLPSSWAVAEVS